MENKMAVVETEIKKKAPYAEGQSFGEAGVYERIDGVVTFAVDPENEANRSIVDLNLTPRDTDGRVRFQSDFSLLIPKNPDRGNGRLLVDVVNRGRKKVVDTFNRAPSNPEGTWENPPGDGFLFKKGYSVVSIWVAVGRVSERCAAGPKGAPSRYRRRGFQGSDDS